MTEQEHGSVAMGDGSADKFTTGEIYQLFPDGIPMVLMKLIFPEKSKDLTIGEIRQIARALSHPVETANCCKCGRIIDTREQKDGGDEFGAELTHGRWTCSLECWDAVVDPQSAHGTSATDPAPAVKVLPPVVTGQMEVEPDVTAADLGVNAEPADDDAECCVACDEPFEDGDLVYWSSDDTGHLHEDCCGPEREAYVNADGSPLQDGEPIPKPFEWRAGR